jgi:hypothetical protein|tara:strand:+ start:297 stop:542 length:246 start_codon:yes stop_codon:yes gene_type:complete
VVSALKPFDLFGRSYSLSEQVKWHPDKFAGGNDEKAKEFAAELSQKANEAARIAKMQAKEAAAKQRRMAAYGKLQGMPSLH